MESLSKNKILTPTLKNHSQLNENTDNAKSSISVPLMLTPLVDAFAILVIYLLVNTTAAPTEVKVDGSISLPMAQKIQDLDSGIVIKVKNGGYFIDDRPVSKNSLLGKLRDLMAKQDPNSIPALLVEADKDSEFDNLSPIMVAGSNAGFEKIKFAVIRGRNK